MPAWGGSEELLFAVPQGKDIELLARGRHDPCVVPRAVPMVEAVVALVLADQLLQHYAQVRFSGRVADDGSSVMPISSFHHPRTPSLLAVRAAATRQRAGPGCQGAHTVPTPPAALMAAVAELMGLVGYDGWGLGSPTILVSAVPPPPGL
jgi:hypothetical protein